MTDSFSPDVWREAGRLFHEVADLAPAERAARLAALPEGSPVREATLALLAGDAVAASRLPVPGFGLLPTDLQEDDPLQLVGRAVGHFHVEAYSAAGGMGVVYRARDVRLGRQVALKFLPPLRRLAPTAREQFLAEARSAGALDHPNLCALYEVGESASGPYLVMPWYAGETLRARLRRGALPRAEVLAIGRQVAAGLAAAHAAGIAHRDVKPENVMLLEGGAAKLLDFGLASLPSAPRDANAAFGTAAYMAPEQRAGGRVDTQCDLWALGLLLHELASGTLPAARAELAERASLPTGAASAVPVAPLPPWARDELASLLGSLLTVDPAQRGPAAAAVAQRLSDLERAPGVITPRVSAAAIRRRIVGTAAIAIGGVLAAWFAVFGAPWQRPATAADARLVLADVRVIGADSALGAFSTSVLREHLTRSRRVALVTRPRVDSLRRLMRVDAAQPLDSSLARAVAQRDGAAAVIVSDLVPRGEAYLLTARVVDAATGADLAVVHARAPHGERELIEALGSLGRALRERVGESRRDLRSEPSLPQLTTHSVEALRAVLAAQRLLTSDPRGAALQLRRAVDADSTFAYAQLLVANTLNNPLIRTAARDSALARMYRYREALSLMELSQVTGLYWWHLGLDRHRAARAFEMALAADSLQIRALGNLTDLMLDRREFARAERLALRLGRFASAPIPLVARPHIRALIGQGRVAAADSLRLAYRARDPRFADSPADRLAQLEIALATQRFDDALPLASGPLLASVIARLQGRLRDASRLGDAADSALLASVEENLVTLRLPYRRAVTDAEAALWVAGQPAIAVARLDSLLAAQPPRELSETQDRLDLLRAAATYAAAGRPDRARAVVAAALPAARDSLVRRALHSRHAEALGEIALAEGRWQRALTHFRASDLGPDGLPVSRCQVCVLPRLARVYDRAGDADSARALWARYVETPALDRLPTDQWFLQQAYQRLAALSAAAGNREAAQRYAERASSLRSRADAGLRNTGARTR